jgi:hypothetical protein
MLKLFITATAIVLVLACGANKDEKISTPKKINLKKAEIPAKISQIETPKGYQRIESDPNSFGNYLQTLPLKDDNTVYLFDGSKKLNQTAQFAVIDVSIGNKNLQQCADAVMRLRAEYLFDQQNYNSIVFTDNENNTYAFTKPYTHEHLLQYLEKVFGMCGTASLAKQLKPLAEIEEINIGDVIIKGGFPGHAVIVVDKAINANNKALVLLAQSYMPAQNIHVLKNDNHPEIGPWYNLSEGESIITPEYVFSKNACMTW